MEEIRTAEKRQSARVDTGASVNVIRVDALPEGVQLRKTNGNTKGADGKSFKVHYLLRMVCCRISNWRI